MVRYCRSYALRCKLKPLPYLSLGLESVGKDIFRAFSTLSQAEERSVVADQLKELHRRGERATAKNLDAMGRQMSYLHQAWKQPVQAPENSDDEV